MTRPRIKRLKEMFGRETPINADTARPDAGAKTETPEGSDVGEADRSPVVPAGEHLTSPASTPEVHPAEPAAESADEADSESTADTGEIQEVQPEPPTEEPAAETPADQAEAPDPAAVGAGVQADQPDDAEKAKAEKAEEAQKAKAARAEEKKAEKARKAEAKEARRAEKAERAKKAKEAKAARKAEKAKKADEAKAAALAAKPDKDAKPEDAPTQVQPVVGTDEKKRRKLPRGVLVAGILVVVAGASAGGLLASGVLEDDDDDDPATEAPAPIVSGDEGDEGSVKRTAEDAASQLGFPTFATKNTTRIGGGDAATTAAGASLAVYPSAGGSEPPEAVSIAADGDWQAGIAAAVLMAEPVRAPLLVSVGGALPPASEEALDTMSPQGSPTTGGASVFSIGDDAGAPEGYNVTRVTGADPATVAAAVAKLRRKLTKKPPRHLVVTTSEDGAFAMPAAAWAARSGDPVLFAEADKLPAPTAAFLKKNKNVPVYVLGPPAAISANVVRQISRVSSQVVRVAGEDPVTNAIEFARFVDGSFGWNINDPGHGFVVARSDRPMDAGAAAPISASGTWGPLLLTEAADSLPGPLRGYFLDVKPGYRTDPTRALYNRVWIIGDEEAIDVNQQAALDELADLARIGGGE